jgi:hypothetical protein
MWNVACSSLAIMNHALANRRAAVLCTLWCATLLLPAAVAAQKASAEPWFRAGTVMITAQAGGAAFTDFQRGTARSSDANANLQEFQRRVSAHTTASVGGWLAVWLSGGWGLRGAASFTPSAFEVRNERSAQRVLDERTGGTRLEYAGLHIVTGDVAVLFRFPPKLGRFVPYGIAGGGVIRYASRSGDLPPEARDRFSRGTHTMLSGVLGLGAAVPLQKGDLLLTFEFTDHISRTPLDDAGAGESFEMAGVALQLEPEASRNDTDGVGVTNTVRLLVGFTLPIR